MIIAVIPVKALENGKSRLSAVLDRQERVTLIDHLFRHTLAVLAETPHIAQTMVISPDPRVLEMARQQGAYALVEAPLDPGADQLNAALAQAARQAAVRGASSLLILPADLPFVAAADIQQILDTIQPDHIAICPDQHQQGTNALLLTPPQPFSFHYGPDSFHLHQQEALQQGRGCVVVQAKGLQFDLDTVADLEAYRDQQAAPLAPDVTTCENRSDTT
jgi:2-phospho-L-lactate guanylyltransferase